jgi:aspartyl-tRNA(Asn)/glutamyl-tRNA(Gln) amidotransferase subunit C
MAIGKDVVARIAGLARIRVAEEELDPLAAELSRIVAWVEELNEVETSGVAPMASTAVSRLPMRADVVTDGDCRDAIVEGAPKRARGFFVVPKVVE